MPSLNLAYNNSLKHSKDTEKNLMPPQISPV